MVAFWLLMCCCFRRNRAGDGPQVGQQTEVHLHHQTEPSAPPLVDQHRCIRTSLFDHNHFLSLRFRIHTLMCNICRTSPHLCESFPPPPKKRTDDRIFVTEEECLLEPTHDAREKKPACHEQVHKLAPPHPPAPRLHQGGRRWLR